MRCLVALADGVKQEIPLSQPLLGVTEEPKSPRDGSRAPRRVREAKEAAAAAEAAAESKAASTAAMVNDVGWRRR